MKRLPSKSKKYTTPSLRSAHIADAQAAYMSQRAKKPLDLLGLPGSRKGDDIQHDNDFITLIRKGLPRKALDTLIQMIELSDDEVAHVFHISTRTLRRHTASSKLNQEQSERLIELARLYSRGEEVFGSMDQFKKWMNDTILSLGNKRPKDFLDTSLGIDVLQEELGRIEQGVYS